MHVHDFAAVGVGPFNLGLACLTEPLDLDGVFLESGEQFDWHPGMMLEDATLQVPFLADLTTMADPTSPYGFLNYLKQTGRLYPFYIRESFHPLRSEYQDYCRWAAAQLPSVRFGQHVERIEHDGSAYVVRTAAGDVVHARRLVLGIGTTPWVPEPARALVGDPGRPVLHTADYLTHRERLRAARSVTVVGSGQSAAEVYADLLGTLAPGRSLHWVTRAPRFFPMEYTKLTLELTSPEYAAYFHELPGGTRDRLLREQRSLYKGISSELVDAIFDRLYAKRSTGEVDTTLVTGAALTALEPEGDAHRLRWHHEQSGEQLELTTDAVVLATGYRAGVPDFLEPVRDRVRWDDQGRYAVSAHYSVDHGDREIFVQNAEEHTHGLVAPDLGMGAHRNATIIAAMLGREVYPVEKRIAVQHFGVPDHLRVMEEAR